jgi:pentose-5-phosphate-3-epimerase
MKILPAINTENFDEAKNRINLLKDLTKEFHIDISSSDFSNYQTWQNPKDIDRLEEDLKLHLHLMIKLKPQEILKWDNKRVKSFILHLEGTNLPDALIKFSKKTKKNIFIAWSPKI